jgi:hypothetical protein
MKHRCKKSYINSRVGTEALEHEDDPTPLKLDLQLEEVANLPSWLFDEI